MRKFIFHLVGSLLFPLFALGCSANKQTPAPDYVVKLKDSAEFLSLQGAPLHQIFSQTLCLKFVYEIKTNRTFFINSKKYKYHHDFCYYILKNYLAINEFNNINYSPNPKRQYVLGVLNFYPNINKYALEFVVEDSFNDVLLTQCISQLEKNSYLKNKIHVLCNTNVLENMKQKTAINFKWISPNTISESENYKPIITGKITGKLVYYIKMKQAMLENQKNNIIITAGSPLEIPNCKGFITTSVLSPLSHAVIFCSQQKIVSASIQKADEILTWKNEWVTIEINSTGFKINKATEKEIAVTKKENITKKITLLKMDTTIKSIELNTQTQHAMGNKASGVLFLQKVSSKHANVFKAPQFTKAIPFYYYSKHLQGTEIKNIIKNALKNYNDGKYKESENDLDKIQKMILEKPINSTLLNEIIAYTNKIHKPKMRFRSSCNAEDLAEFNGAGLYNSYSGYLNPADKQLSIEMAIKKVWASSFTNRAWRARRNANIDEFTVQMAVLIQEVFDNETSNGVAISKNIYRQNYPGYTISIQSGENSVVLPDSNIVCEHILLFKNSDFNFGKNPVMVQLITESSISKNKRILDIQKAEKLYAAVRLIEEYWTSNLRKDKTIGSMPLDIEFKFIGNELIIKQVREYNH